MKAVGRLVEDKERVKPYFSGCCAAQPAQPTGTEFICTSVTGGLSCAGKLLPDTSPDGTRIQQFNG